MKFRHLKIDLNRGNTYNCHTAAPQKINFEWLEKNTGNLFNTEINVREREMMLRNERNASCEQSCWVAEDHGAISPRIGQSGQAVTHTTTVTTPEIVDLTVNVDCNLTCSYCCGEYSSAWQRDLINHGNYTIRGVQDPRYSLTTQDKILSKISQSELHNTSRYKKLLNELQSYKSTLKKIEITGGEPLLDNQLLDLLSSLQLNPDCQIVIYSGLGVSMSRFQRLIQQLSQIKNLTVKVSAETIESFLEFNRYGTNWDEFQKKIYILDQHVDWKFHSVISNLTIFGFSDFVKHFKNKQIQLTFAYQPRFMSPFVLDETSKQQIIDKFQHHGSEYKDRIVASISGIPTEEERQGVRDFLIQFTKRRPNISFGIFPKSFLQWLELDNYVV
jgi:organic radical activating enzyme